MIWIWNRKEIFVGNSMESFNEVRRILVTNKINYKYKIVNNNTRRRRRGSFGENMDYAKIYYIYVDKTDFQNARLMLESS